MSISTNEQKLENQKDQFNLDFNKETEIQPQIPYFHSNKKSLPRIRQVIGRKCTSLLLSLVPISGVSHSIENINTSKELRSILSKKETPLSTSQHIGQIRQEQAKTFFSNEVPSFFIGVISITMLAKLSEVVFRSFNEDYGLTVNNVKTAAISKLPPIKKLLKK